MPRRLAQQRMTLCDREWPFHASRAISGAAELLVIMGTCKGRLSLAFCTSCVCYTVVTAFIVFCVVCLLSCFVPTLICVNKYVYIGLEGFQSSA